MPSLWDDATSPYTGQDQQPQQQPWSLIGMLHSLIGQNAQRGPQEPMVQQDPQTGMAVPYVPPPTPSVSDLAYSMTGAKDVQQAYQAAQRGEVLPAIGQGAYGALQAASLAYPAFRGATAAGPVAREMVEGIPALLQDESGALRLGRRLPETSTVARTDPAFGSAPYPGAQFPQYAESYPENAPPTPTLDPRKGTTFPAKTLTPEGQAFAAERQRIMADMAKNEWTPYYDPAQRFHVDPANYPSTADTATVVPARPETIERHLANIGSEQSRANLQTAYERGSAMPNTSDWYAMGQLEQDYIKQLGPEAGRKAFQDRFAASMAATTGGAPPTSNYLLSSYLNYLRENNLPYPQNAYELPYPIGGGKYGVMPNVAQHQKIIDAGGFSALDVSNPKRYDFAHSFTGDPSRPVMDEQMISGMTPGVSSAPSTYGLYGQVAREEAAKAGVTPQNFQEVGWAGFKNLKDPNAYPAGKPMIQEINESIERTHRLTGMPRDEIVRRGVIGGQIPMYGLLGAIGLGGAAGTLDPNTGQGPR